MVKDKEIDKKEITKAVPKKQVVKLAKPALPKNLPVKLISEKKIASTKAISATKKTAEKTDRADKIDKESVVKTGSYIEAVGRRKTAIARVRLYNDKEGKFVVNGKLSGKYFLTKELERIIRSPFEKIQEESGYSVTVIAKGGGIHAQAEAIRHGVSRCLVSINEEYRKRLRGAGFLTRDSRMRERKKFGLLRARRAPQFSKR
ncbi:MAG: 30S ribosomal protein S9 [bacterium]